MRDITQLPPPLKTATVELGRSALGQLIVRCRPYKTRQHKHLHRWSEVLSQASVAVASKAVQMRILSKLLDQG